MKESANKKGFIVWHPEIHKIQGEVLYFYLLEIERLFADDIKDIYAEIKNILEGCGIKGYCSYLVFGRYDFLLRVWLRPGKEKILEEKLIERSIKVVDRFICEEIYHYLFRKEKINPKEIAQKIAGYDKDRLNKLQDVKLNNRLLKKLEDQGLAFFKQRESPDKIKFYIIFNYLVSNYSQKEIRSDVKECLNAENAIKDISLYFGTGFGRLLVKGVVENKQFYEIIPFIARIVNKIKTVKMTSETLIIGKLTEDEWDNVDFSEPVEKYKDLIEILKIEEKELKDLEEDKKRTLSNFLLQIDQNQIDDILKRIFIGVIRKDGEIIRKEMVFFFDIEHLLSRLFWLSMEKLYGPEWQRTKGREFAEAIGRDNLKNMAVYDYVCLLGYMDDKGIFEKELFEINLPKGWQGILREMVGWRNDLAHGKIDGSGLLEVWEKVVRLFVNLIPIHGALKKSIEKLEKSIKGI